MEDFFYQFQHSVNDGTIWVYIALIILALAIIGILFSIIFLFLRTIGKIGLTRGAWQADEGKEKLTFSGIMHEVWPYFWKVLLFTIVLAVLGIIAGIIMVLPIIFVSILTLGCGLICLIPILIAIGWFITVLTEFTITSIVNEGKDIMQALESAWNVIIKNPGQVILMGLILFIGQLVIGFLLFLPLLLIAAPVILGIIAQTRALTIAGIVLSGAGFLVYILLMIFAGAILQSYVGTAWTLVYRRLTGRGTAEAAAPSMEILEEHPGEPPENQALSFA